MRNLTLYIACVFIAIVCLWQNKAIALQDSEVVGDVSTNKQIFAKTNTNASAAAAASRYDDGEELIFSLIIDDFILGEVFAVYSSGQFYFHFGDFVSAVDFQIIQDGANIKPKYQGWWAKSSNRFQFDANASGQNPYGTILSNEFNAALNETDYLKLYDELFVSETALRQWFSAGFSYDFTKLRVMVSTSELWPIQQVQNRKNSQTNSRSKRIVSKEPHYDPGYHTISPQMLDFNASIAKISIKDVDERNTLNYGLLGRNDLLNWSAQYYLGGSDIDYTSQAFVTFSRHWTNPDKAPFGITNVQFGDIQPVRITGKSFSTARGITFSNKELGVELDQESTNISGYVQKGWDVELYQNGVLVAQELNIDSGRYEFLDVLLFAGKNEFEIKKFGPQGQVASEFIVKYSQLVDRALFDPSYEISLVENNKTVLGVNNLQGKQDYVSLDGRYSMGVSEGVSLNINHSIVLSEGEKEIVVSKTTGQTNDAFNRLTNSTASNIFGTGLTARLFDNVAVNTQLIHVEDKYNRATVSLFTNLANQQIVFNNEVFQAIDNDSNSNSQFLRSELRILGDLGSIGKTRFRHKSELAYLTNGEGLNSQSLQSNISANIGQLGVNNNILLLRDRDQQNGDYTNFIVGDLGISAAIGKVYTRTGLNYDVNDGFEINSGFVSVDYSINQAISLNAEFSKAFQDDFERVSLGIDWKHDLYAVTTTLDYNTTRGTSFFVNGRVSVGEAPTEFGYINNRFSLTAAGTVLVRAFHDVNRNGIYDSEDFPIKGAKIRALQGNRTAKTDVVGIAQFDNLTNFTKTDIVVDNTSLENPFLVRTTQLTSITPRPGLLTLINYPFVEGAEIEGEVSFVNEFGDVQYAANLALVLIDKNGDIQHQFKTSFDGYFYVPGIIPHDYILDIAPSAKKGAYRLSEVIPVNISEQAQIVSGLDFTVQAKNVLTGYYVLTGEFNSEQMLQAYYQSLRPTLDTLSIQTTPFQHKISNGKLALGITFTEKRENAETICDALESMVNNCVIEVYRYYQEVTN